MNMQRMLISRTITFLKDYVILHKCLGILPPFSLKTSAVQGTWKFFHDTCEHHDENITLHTTCRDNELNVKLQNLKKSSLNLDELMIVSQPVSTERWKELVKLSKSKNVSMHSFENQIMSLCISNKNFPVAKSLMHFLETCERKPSVFLLSQYIRLCALCLDIAGEDSILKYYKKLNSENQKLEFKVLSNLLFGLAATSNWKLCLQLLEDNNHFGALDSLRPHYLMICKAALEKGDVETCLHILHKMITLNMLPSTDVCHEWFLFCKNQRKHNCQQAENSAVLMLDFLRTNLMYVPQEISDKIQEFYYSSRNGDWEGEYVTIPESGLCPHCNNTLEPSELSKEELKILQDHFISKIFNGSDVQLKILPQEIKRFREFLKDSYPFQYVIDGSLAFYQNKLDTEKPENKLCKFVIPLIERKRKNIIIIGSTQMKNWKSNEFSYINQKCHLFLSSSYKVDALLLLAGLYGGSEAFLISRYALSNYKKIDQNQNVAALLKRWLLNRQLIVERSEYSADLELMTPVSYNAVVQYSDKTVHIPCTRKSELITSFYLPDSWMCLRNRKYNEKQLTVKK